MVRLGFTNVLYLMPEWRGGFVNSWRMHCLGMADRKVREGVRGR